FKIDGSYFFTTSSLNHELKFGGRTREAKTSTLWSYSGRNIFHYDGTWAGVAGDAALGAAFGLPPGRADDYSTVYAYRNEQPGTTANYDSLWVQDTMTMGAWTFNVGFRWDDQSGENAAGEVEANLGFPTVMPAIQYPGDNGGGLNWTSITPRLGVTYALGEERKTLIRGSFSQFPDQLSLGNISRLNPLGSSLVSMLVVNDPGGFPGFYDDGEQFAVLSGFWGFNPNNPTSIANANVNDPSMDAPLTNELILGAEHAFLPEFVTSLTVTWRNVTDYQDFQRLFENNATGEITTIPASEYIRGPDIEITVPGIGGPAATYSQPYFSADPDKWSYTGGSLFTNGDREIDYVGATLGFTKRLANQWMMRGYIQYNFDESWNVPGSYFNNNDPNRVLPGVAAGSTIDGSTYVVQSTGSGRNESWLQTDWGWNLNGMYQVAPDRPWGFNVAANMTGRQGYPIPYYRSRTGLDGIGRSIQAAPNITDYRLGDLFTMDMRLEKEFRGTGNLGFTFSIDAFNIFNDGVVLDRFRNTTSGNVGWISTSLAPRVFRLGVRVNWR
ncbi:MAG: TonB-dependent receptor, partial [Thermoanaerobaculia bacterium]